MQDNSNVIEIGIFQVRVTPELRSLFERTHQKMSGARPTEVQFTSDEQYEMYLACEVEDPSTEEGSRQQTSNFLELIHYLTSQGLSVPRILAEVRCSTNVSFEGVQPRSLSMHLHAQDARRRAAQAAQKSFSAGPLFMAPSLAGSLA